MRMIFVSMPVKDPSRSITFFKALGFEHNPKFSDDNGACIVISESIYVMVVSETKFASFLNGGQVAKGVTEMTLSLSCDSKEELLDLKAKFIANGGSEIEPDNDYGFMYDASLRDPDGHGWGLVYMSGEPPQAG